MTPDPMYDEDERFDVEEENDEYLETFEVTIVYKARLKLPIGTPNDAVRETISELIYGEIEENGEPVGARWEITRVE